MTWLCDRGHVASAREFSQAGVSRRRLAAAVSAGTLLALRVGVYACSHIDELDRQVAAAGVRFDCVSALARHENLWSGTGTHGLHVRARTDGRAPQLGAEAVHWGRQFREPLHPLEVSPVDALLQAMRCLKPIDALASIESALHLGYLDRDGLDRLIDLAPARMLQTLARVDPASGSGFETHTRVNLEDAGHHVASQVEIPGAGAIDLLVDDCVGIETDGRKWHEQRFIADRTKDLRVGAWGIPVLRIGGPHIFEWWPETLGTIERLIAESPRRRATAGRRFFPPDASLG